MRDKSLSSLVLHSAIVFNHLPRSSMNLIYVSQEAEAAIKFYRAIKTSEQRDEMKMEFESIKSLVSESSIKTKITLTDFCEY